MVTIRVCDTEVYVKDSWTAWISSGDESDEWGTGSQQVWGDSKAEVVGKIILEFPEYFGGIDIEQMRQL